jgi:hypothetical protein
MFSLIQQKKKTLPINQYIAADQRYILFVTYVSEDDLSIDLRVLVVGFP